MSELNFNQFVAKRLINDFKGICNKYNVEINNSGILPEEFSLLTKLFYLNIINKQEYTNILSNRIIELQGK